MRVSKMVRLAFAAAAVTVFGAACAEPTSAPASKPLVTEEAPIAFGTVAIEVDDDMPDEGSFKFYWDTRRAYAGPMGKSYLELPANVVCDPATSGYGLGMWDKPCTLATQPILMTVSWEKKNGVAVMNFSPDVRFVPTNDPAKMVRLTMKYSGSMKDAVNHNILWRSSTGGWYDESKVDPSLKPVVNSWQKTVSRRLKHFSGYAVTVGFYQTDATGLLLNTVGGLLGW